MTLKERIEIQEKVKAAMPHGWRYTLKVYDESTSIIIRSGPEDLIGEINRCYRNNAVFRPLWFKVNAKNIASQFDKNVDSMQNIVQAMTTSRVSVLVGRPGAPYICRGSYVR